MLKVNLFTRSISKDYSFLNTPEELWWKTSKDSNPYSGMDFNKPQIIIEAEKDNWRIFISAIPTSRYDGLNNQGRPIRNSIAISGNKNSDDDFKNHIVKFIFYWLKYLSEIEKSTDLVFSNVKPVLDCIDKCFTEEYIEINTPHDNKGIHDNLDKEISERFFNSIKGLPDDELLNGPGSSLASIKCDVHLAAGIKHPNGLKSFIEYTKQLITGGQKGRIIYYNVAVSDNDFAPFKPKLDALNFILFNGNFDIKQFYKKKPNEALQSNKSNKSTIPHSQVDYHMIGKNLKRNYVLVLIILILSFALLLS